MVYSHTKVLDKNVFLKELLSRLDDQSIIKLQMPLKRIANMFNQEIEPIAIYIRRILNKMHQLSYSNLCSNIRFNSKQYEMSEFISLYFNNNEESTNQQQYLRQFIKENNKAEYLNLLHEFFFSSNEEISKFAIKLFFSKLFLINEENVNFYSKNKDAMFFKFELNSSSPYFNCRLQQQQTPSNNEETSSNNNNGETENQNNKAFNYYITVINNIDSFDENCRENFAALDNMQISTAKINVEDTFLFIIKYNEKQNENCEECAKNLKDWFTASLGSDVFDVKPRYIDLMLSTKLKQPFYTTTLDFSAREKLELYRLPLGAENLTHPDSPYLIFRTNDHGLSRIFVRCSLKNISSITTIHERFSQIDESTLLQNKIFELLDGACGEIRVSCAADKSRSTFDCNHVFIRLEYDTEIGKRNTDYWPRSIEEAIKRCEKYLIKHRITEVEVNYEQLRPSTTNTNSNNIAESQQHFETIRIVYMNETGAIPEICVYRINEDRKLIPIESGGHARLAGKSSATPHHTIQQVNVQKKRYQANKLGTTYVYDMPIMFGKAAFDEWTFFKRSDPKSYSAAFEMLPSEQQLAINNSDVRKLAKVFEMILTSDDPNAQLNIIRSEEELNRRMSSGCNDRGMIAWEMQIWTPDSPHGRTIVLISNDITFQMGSFSMREHRLYQKASEYSRINKMPRVYIAANSGARIGFASDIKNHLNIVWNDDDRPEDGFKYLTLDPKVENSEILSQIESTLLNNGNRRIDAIIGKEGDIGVENLVGSGLIAAETSAAYRKVPTYCLVNFINFYNFPEIFFGVYNFTEAFTILLKHFRKL
uniref:CoA carboxyltransferase N-terminal domain-containing protein n=1 Tax=Meloidogyne enterolobii TaxID=390850 RepID=A0A6V7UMS5_MELEN|nr:unnamed protein product [Meloidogyne enterolobii]